MCKCDTLTENKMPQQDQKLEHTDLLYEAAATRDLWPCCGQGSGSSSKVDSVMKGHHTIHLHIFFFFTFLSPLNETVGNAGVTHVYFIFAFSRFRDENVS